MALNHHSKFFNKKIFYPNVKEITLRFVLAHAKKEEEKNNNNDKKRSYGNRELAREKITVPTLEWREKYRNILNLKIH